MTSDALLPRLEKLCSRCECCTSDVMDRAVRLLVSDARRLGEELSYESAAGLAAQILTALVSEGYVDDARYASAFASEKSGLAGWGPVKIRQALRAKRIPDDVISSALQQIDLPRARVKLVKLLESKWKSLQSDPQGRLKLIRFALGRGYDYDEVSDLVESITSPR